MCIFEVMVKSKSFPFLQIEYLADVQFGYLRVGDLLTLTDDNLYFNNVFVTVLSKEWTGLQWNYILGVQDNAIALSRHNE